MISVGVLLGYALQFFVAIEILWPSIQEKYKFKYPLIGELCFRTMMVLLTCKIIYFPSDLHVFIIFSIMQL